MKTKFKFNWEGYPKGVEEWMRKQEAPVTIFMHPSGGEFIYVLGETPLFLYENASTYVKWVDKNYEFENEKLREELKWIHGYCEFDIEKIREDFCIAVEDISVTEFVRSKLIKIREILRRNIYFWLTDKLYPSDEGENSE